MVIEFAYGWATPLATPCTSPRKERVYGGVPGDVTPLLAAHLLAAHHRLVPIDHSHIVVAGIIPKSVAWPDF